MITFGLVVSAFDLLTVALPLVALNASGERFRAGRLLVMVLAELLIMLVIGMQRRLFRIRTSHALLLTPLTSISLTLLPPFGPLGPPRALPRWRAARLQHS